MTENQPIDDFLGRCLRALRDKGEAPWELGENIEPREVWTRIEFHGLPMLLHQHADCLPNWPSGLLERIAEEARLLALWEATHRKCVGALVEALSEAGIESVFMKGTALAYSVHEDPAVRRRGDSDLLIRPGKEQAAREVFESTGWYRKNDAHGLYFQEGWLFRSAGIFEHAIDLHWQPTDSPLLHPVLPLETFFSNREPLKRLSPNSHRPDWATLVLHGAINQKWHAVNGYDAEYEKLASPRRHIWSVDFDLLARAMSQRDWERLVEISSVGGVAPLVADALRGAQQQFGTLLDEQSMCMLEQAVTDAGVRAYFSSSDTLSKFWLDLRNARGLDGKARMIFMRAFPPRKHLLKKYPGASGWRAEVCRGGRCNEL